jgi:D-alanyl-D-alanine dipeptidase
VQKEHPVFARSQQLIVVVTPGWTSQTGQLYRFERKDLGAEWTPVDRTEVTVGRTGIAWGRGLLDEPISPGPSKREGDGKAPAGIFSLGTAFGYAEASRSGITAYPYLQVTANFLGIDDPKSIHYNTIVDRRTIPTPDWDSAEIMLRPDALYEYGLVIEHNANPGKQSPGLGSCIFLHVWSGAESPTAGCTAMRREKMAELLIWLQSAKNPRLVQLTTADYAGIQEKWGLPNLESHKSSWTIPMVMTATVILLAAIVFLAIRRRAANVS